MKLTILEKQLYAECIREDYIKSKNYFLNENAMISILSMNDDDVIRRFIEATTVKDNFDKLKVTSAEKLQELKNKINEKISTGDKEAAEKLKELYAKQTSMLSKFFTFLKSVFNSGFNMAMKLFEKAKPNFQKASETSKQMVTTSMNNINNTKNQIISTLSIDKFSWSAIKKNSSIFFSALKSLFSKGLKAIGYAGSTAAASQVLAIMSLIVSGILALKSLKILSRLVPIAKKVMGWIGALISAPFKIGLSIVTGLKNLVLKILGRST